MIVKKNTSINIEQLKIETFKNILIGSYVSNGVTWNKIKRMKTNKNLNEKKLQNL